MQSELVRAIDRDPRSVPEIAAAAGMDRVQLWRFATGQRGISLTTADALAEALGFSAKLVRRGRKGKR